MLKKSLLAAITLTALIISGCTTTRYIYEEVELSYPPRRPLPAVAPAELMCVSDDAFKRLVLRETILTTRVRMLENIIDTTKGDPDE